jgi:hypothetical protein
VSTFWKPRGRGRIGTAIPAYRKQLGHAVYELWFRCDLCFKSDPFPAAYTWRRGLDESQLCAACDTAAMQDDALRGEGWRRVP